MNDRHLFSKIIVVQTGFVEYFTVRIDDVIFGTDKQLFRQRFFATFPRHISSSRAHKPSDKILTATSIFLGHAF